MIGQFWSGVLGMHGIFVPPNSVHNTIDGVPYHGGGSETLMIGSRVWRRGAGEEWIEISNPSPIGAALSASWSGVLFIPGYLDHVPNHVGAAACLDEVEKDHRRYRLYEYAAYLDDFQNVMKLAAKRRLFVDTATDLPAIFEDLDDKGQVARRETRTYDKDITIIPPSHASPMPGQKTF